MKRTRAAAVAGSFYPERPAALTAALDSFLKETQVGTPVPKAIVVPHAGYVYSGPIAAQAFACLAGARERIRRVVLLGPSHYVPFSGLATSGVDVFATPLGEIAIDRQAEATLEPLPQVQRLPAAHSREHCLEVQLPFLQRVLADFKLVPLVVGEASPTEVAEVLELLWGAEETLIVISSDLSHYHDYRQAQEMDLRTCRAIENLECSDIDSDHACGCRAINGLVVAAKAHGLEVTTLDLRNSGDTAGPRDRVVGYGAWAFA